jgi:hypothetical protein
VRFPGRRPQELAAGGDVELGEDLGQVVFDGTRGQEQLGGDLRVRHARLGQPRDPGLLGVSGSRMSAECVRTVPPLWPVVTGFPPRG